MPADAPVAFTFAGLPEGYCFTTPERFALDIVSQMQGYIPGEYSVIIKSETEPDVEDRDKDWHVVSGGAPTGKIFSWYQGQWVHAHPIPAGPNSLRVWWDGPEDATLWSFDGGDGIDPASVIPTAASGAMWEVDHNYDFRFPLAAGTSPAPLSTVVAQGTTGGSEEVTLTTDEIPAHAHSLNNTGTNKFGRYNENSGNQNPFGSGNSGDYEGDFIFSTQNTGGGEGHSNMPPYRAGFWIKRTGRVFETI